jgi:hypothetical protein
VFIAAATHIRHVGGRNMEQFQLGDEIFGGHGWGVPSMGVLYN